MNKITNGAYAFTLLVMMTASCSNNATSAGSSEESEVSSSTMVSSATLAPTVPTAPLSSSAMAVPPAQQISSSSSESLFAGEVGYVCNGFNIDAVTPSRATEGYLAMYNICGDMATMTTGNTPRYASVLDSWMVNDLALDANSRSVIVNDVVTYGASLRFYNAVDGYLRYIYIEPYGDGRGLVKKSLR